ncbi:putative NAD dependent epimerase/dehydratase [Apodospora peruviana]|uniref:NAD dependent epimerase/dehydratase n=1 Tax=Apodospora peruviana TaxID=516989 RepID=A0AAE0I045_9PEZI|nr:putative NAD dependent epimerase/dehydratase [Apodospora peruviana]
MKHHSVLLTGGSGFIASHILDALLRRRYWVTVTVRSEEKGLRLQKNYPEDLRPRISFTVVEDIVQEGAFDNAVKVQPFDYIIHTACPYHFNFTDPIADFIDPAVKGTVGILKSAKAYAPTVKRVVLLSSSATILNPFNHSKVYDETVHGETSWEQAMNPRLAYRASKIFAEKAAFEFISTEKPPFDLVVLNPPLVFGPAPSHLVSLDALNTSNQRIRDLVLGKFRSPDGDSTIPPTGPVYIFCDVRDVAEAHVKALEAGPEASGQRFFLVGGYFSNKRLADAVRITHTGLANKLPDENKVVDDMPEDVYGWDNEKSRRVLGLEYRDLQTCVNDSVEAILRIAEQEGVSSA